MVQLGSHWHTQNRIIISEMTAAKSYTTRNLMWIHKSVLRLYPHQDVRRLALLRLTRMSVHMSM